MNQVESIISGVREYLGRAETVLYSYTLMPVINSDLHLQDGKGISGTECLLNSAAFIGRSFVGSQTEGIIHPTRLITLVVGETIGGVVFQEVNMPEAANFAFIIAAGTAVGEVLFGRRRHD